MNQQDLKFIFIDLEKACDIVPYDMLGLLLFEPSIMHEGVSTSFKTWGGEADDFTIIGWLNKDSTLSLYLFDLDLDVFMECI